MGDIIETTIKALQPFEPLLFYEVNSNTLCFDIKTANRALVGLAKDSDGRCQCWIEFSNPGTIIISQEYIARINKSGLPFTLSNDEYNRFWIAWDSIYVWAGIGENWDVVISSPINTKFNNITFATKDSRNPCSFRFEAPLNSRVPPILNEPIISAGELQWKQCDNQLPDEAVIGGYIDGETVYIVRAHHRQSLTPGVFVPSKGLAFIPWGGSDNPTGNFEALCGFNFKWVPASKNRVPVDAFVAGYSEENREPLYIGRVSCQDKKIPGKVQLSHATCYIAYQGREIAEKNYEVLTVPGLNLHCSNKFVEHKDHNTDNYPDNESDLEESD